MWLKLHIQGQLCIFGVNISIESIGYCFQLNPRGSSHILSYIYNRLICDIILRRLDRSLKYKQLPATMIPFTLSFG